MIAFLEGCVSSKTLGGAVISVGGVGFEVGMSQRSLAALPAVGEQARIYTYLSVREDDLSLFGFELLEEKVLFEKLIGVSGVGPKVALAALSSYEPQKLVELIATQDVSAVQKIPGIGKKTASRIILELKGSLEREDGSFVGEPAPPNVSTAWSAAQEALLAMGFTSAEAQTALQGAPADAPESALLQYALKRLGS